MAGGRGVVLGRRPIEVNALSRPIRFIRSSSPPLFSAPAPRPPSRARDSSSDSRVAAGEPT
eukprot:5839234-Pyramimonas_sp.AAC.1